MLFIAAVGILSLSFSGDPMYNSIQMISYLQVYLWPRCHLHLRHGRHGGGGRGLGGAGGCLAG